MNAVIIRMATAALAAAAAVVRVVAGLAALLRPDEPGGAVLSDDDRRALAAAPALRGADAAPVDPAVDLTDPEAVARAYLVAAHSLVPGDADHTQRRATGYARPGSPAAVGVVVLDPPPGAHRTAVVTGPPANAAATGRRCAPRPPAPAVRSRPPDSRPSSSWPGARTADGASWRRPQATPISPPGRTDARSRCHDR